MSSSLARYADRRVLVTGGGSGIGQATVLRILDEGGRVVAADISEPGLTDTVTKAGPLAERLTTVLMDVGDEASVRAGVAGAVDAAGGLDTLVNAAGILRSAHFADTTLADFETVVRVNLFGTFLVTREAIPALRRGTAAAVVNFSSTSASFAHPYMSAYAASKGGVQAMTHALALEFSKERIRFNCVQPGSVSSGMTDGVGESRQSVGPGLPADMDFSLLGKIMAVLPLDDGAMFAKPDAVASVVAMLGSPDAYWVTGTEVRVDGGTHMQRSAGEVDPPGSADVDVTTGQQHRGRNRHHRENLHQIAHTPCLWSTRTMRWISTESIRPPGTPGNRGCG